MSIEMYLEQRAQVARCMKRLYERGLTTAGGGNISFRLEDDLFCITPTSLDKECLTPEQIAIVDLDGENLTPACKLSIETEMHRLLFRSRPDIMTIVHAHPVHASAFTSLHRLDHGCPIDTHITAEAYYLLQDPAVVPYAKMGTKELAEKVAEAGKGADVLLMENHGIVTMATTLLKAFEMMDVLDRAAEMTALVHTMDTSLSYRELSKEQREALLQ